jgi:hypothetical protein
MTLDEAIFCEKSYIGETNCKDCKYYGTDTCKSRQSHKMAIKALEQQDRIIQILDDYDLEAWEVLEMIKEEVRA